MKLRFQRRLHASAEVMWPYLVEPELMNLWSTARISKVLPGEQGRMDGVGALREVRIQSGPHREQLLEVIQHSEAGRCLVYRVLEHPLMIEHRGQITLEPSNSEVELTWEVEFSFALPGLAQVAARALKPQLSASLAALARISRSVDTQSELQPTNALSDPTTPKLWAKAEETLSAQQDLARVHAERNAPMRWFSQIYVHVTSHQLQWVRSGQVAHAGWVLRLIPRFYEHYLENVQKYERTVDGWPEAHWSKAFEAMGSSDPHKALYLGLLLGIRAHIEEDLPRALAEVYYQHYREVADYARFRADFLLMGDVFKRSTAALVQQLPEDLIPWYYRLSGRIPPSLLELLSGVMNKRRFYNVAKARREAFERGAAAVRLLERAASA